jgi:hypothetical protein
MTIKMNIYHYNPVTKEYIGQSVADLDPIDKQPLIPAFATDIAPPTQGANQVAQWDGAAWVLVDDYRGQVFYDATGVEHKIDSLGVAPDPAWTTTKPFILDEAKNIKKQQIRTAFTASASQPVTDANSITWDGGYDSALKLDAARRMAELAGQTTVTFYDASNAPHDLALADAAAVVLTLGADYQAKFAAKQALMAQVDALPNTATQSDIDAIIYSL